VAHVTVLFPEWADDSISIEGRRLNTRLKSLEESGLNSAQPSQRLPRDKLQEPEEGTIESSETSANAPAQAQSTISGAYSLSLAGSTRPICKRIGMAKRGNEITGSGSAGRLFLGRVDLHLNLRNEVYRSGGLLLTALPVLSPPV